MEPGDVLWHHPLVVHGAEANNSATHKIRAGLTVRFLGDKVKWDPPSYLNPLGKQPKLKKGEFIEGDTTFPIIWEAQKQNTT
jgi:ectoine hydroxylase-related dioxygenase (phytanoyl-CoA dioxygenase family)